MQPSTQFEYEVDSRPLCQGMPFVLTDAAHPRLVLKYSDKFLVLNREAYIPACSTLGMGYYQGDTRFLSQWEILVDETELSLLSFDVEKGYAGNFLYTNPQTQKIAQQKLMVNRQLILSDCLHEKLSIENFSNDEISIELSIKFSSDFADMFEVRGLNRPSRGQRMLPRLDAKLNKLFLAYMGLDNCLLETIIEFLNRGPDAVIDGAAKFQLVLPPRTPVDLEIKIDTCMNGISSKQNLEETCFADLLANADYKYNLWKESFAQINCEHELVNFSIMQGLRDFYILRQATPNGVALAAGIPWYCAAFGRDSAIAGLQILPYMPELSRECIELLAAYQGRVVNEFKAERPGKIMHELRLGELARLEQIPHTPYYGSVDATALWLILFAKYIDWTADFEFARTHWPQVLAALSWLDSASENGFITYIRESPEGLENQGWKDSGDSICHVDGSLAKPPIALSEAQGYLYAAQLSIAKVAELLDTPALATALQEKSAKLKARFISEFWMPTENFPALALDGDSQQVRSISSNAGHCIWTGILDGEKAHLTADRLLKQEMNSGWGIRTLSTQSANYNPISYHNGSVWPHDNAILLEGLRNIGRIKEGHKIMRSLLSVSQHQQDFRLPELFCGFERTDWNKPVDYPTACSPQAWSAGTIFQMLSACINFQADAKNKTLKIVEPCLPDWLGGLTIRNLKIGQSELDIAFEAANENTYCKILRKAGRLRVIIET